MLALFGAKDNMNLVIYKPEENVIIEWYLCDLSPLLRSEWTSPNGHYYAEIDFLDKNQYSGEDKENTPMNLKCDIFYKTDLKYWYLLLI